MLNNIAQVVGSYVNNVNVYLYISRESGIKVHLSYLP